jgi:hypothetical protein
MNKHLATCLAGALLALVAPSAYAFPPAPAHEIYGTVRDESGRPLDSAEAIVILSGSTSEVTRAPSDPTIGEGVNYRLFVPMDANILENLYPVTALRPALPFTIRVEIRGQAYVPVEMQATTWNIGNPGGRTRINLTLGLDGDGDGLPDSWERSLIDSDPTGKLRTLADVRPSDDLDRDGLTNLQEYLIGTYALDKNDALRLDIVRVVNGRAHLRFTTIAGRTYTVRQSTDMQTWTDATYGVSDTGALTQFPRLRASETTAIDAFVPLGETAAKYFRLHAE